MRMDLCVPVSRCVCDCTDMWDVSVYSVMCGNLCSVGVYAWLGVWTSLEG